MTLRLTIAAPFKHTRKTGMRKNELVYYYALDRKWMSTEQANLLLKRAEEEGLLGLVNGLYSPRFDIAGLTIPVGFKPTSGIFERHDPVQDLIGRIARARSLEETDVVAEMNRIISPGRILGSDSGHLCESLCAADRWCWCSPFGDQDTGVCHRS